MKEIITIQVSKFLTTELAEEIAKKQWKASAPNWTNRSRQYIFDELVNGNDCFGVIATTPQNAVIGRIHCVKNESDPSLWYYGDLFVVPEYRRMGINKDKAWISMLFVAKEFQHQGIGTYALYCAEQYVKEKGFHSIAIQTDIDNIPAQNCYKKFGFQIYEQDSKVKFFKFL